jgi:phospholipase C
MATTRRDFIKRAAVLSAAGVLGGVPEVIARARAIEPAKGTTFLDARHVVILMQENRSFDHAYGSLRGVRGFNDPRALRMPNGLPVWAQSDAKGRTYLPHRLDIRNTNATWMGSLPHSWHDQVDARNGGRCDRWLHVKQSGHEAYRDMPLTMGYYNREDIPFYYALADAFTVCDQNFCSSLTGTTPNRLHLWTGTVRAKQSPDSPAFVYNEDVDYGRWRSWPTFPERLEDHGVSWKIYQNELSLESGLEDEHNAWLTNFGDNPLEWFTQYGVRFLKSHRAYLAARLPQLPAEIEALEAALAKAAPERRAVLQRHLQGLRAQLERLRAEQTEFSDERWAALNERNRRLHERAFCTNAGDPDDRELTDLTYGAGDERRRVPVPRGDILHNFRKDVAEGTLPTVSWLVPPERVSDHPGSAWYGAWYVSEVLDILTQNPRVWQETVFVLTYDENDGYFDHVPPFVAPDPARPETGRVSDGVDAELETVRLESDRALHGNGARQSPIGLGYRVPMGIASPWSRGGFVCSQVFDHTSVIQFVEKFLSHRLGRTVREPNVNTWRRAVCGDLTSAFGSADAPSAALTPVDRDKFVEQIHRAQFRQLPHGFRPLTGGEAEALRRDTHANSLMPRQEPGLRPSRALPYELYVAGRYDAARRGVVMQFEARKELFGDRAAGAAFVVYARHGDFACRNYAVAPGARVEDLWPAGDGGRYDLSAHGPNGYLREFRGAESDPPIQVQVLAPAAAGEAPAELRVEIRAAPGIRDDLTLVVTDHAYGNAGQRLRLAPDAAVTVRVPVRSSHGWYDFGIKLAGLDGFERRFAGRVETGADGFSDPQLSGDA